MCVSSNLIENKTSMTWYLTVEQQVYMYLWLSSLILVIRLQLGFPGGSVVVKKKSPPASAGDVGLIPGSGKSPGGGNGNPLQNSCLGNPMDRGA